MTAQEMTHASFFSGVGGLDLGLERAGWRTVSVSEIDPYACAVLALRFPGAVQLGSITDVVDGWRKQQLGESADRVGRGPAPDNLVQLGRDEAWCHADLWSGGFPCQDLSVAGKRAGFGGERSVLAFAFLALVERHRPPAFLLENVPGLLSSHGGRDMAALLGAVVELGYGVAYRVLDARHFGVPQRRRRVFVLALRSGPDDPSGRLAAERAAEVLAVGARCRRHPPTGVEAGEGAADGAGGGAPWPGFYNATSAFGEWRPGSDAGTLGTIREHVRPGSNTDHTVLQRAAPDPDGVRAADGLAGRMDGRAGLAATLNSGGNSGGFRTEPGEHLVLASLTGGGADSPQSGRVWSGDGVSPTLNLPSTGTDHVPAGFVKRGREQSADDGETWGEGDVMPTLNSFDVGDARTTAAVLCSATDEDPLLPLGLDSHRYRVCGNGVVAPVAEWIGAQLLAALQEGAA